MLAAEGVVARVPWRFAVRVVEEDASDLQMNLRPRSTVKREAVGVAMFEREL